MSLTKTASGIVGLFRHRPTAPAGAGGTMPLMEHFRELRARLMRCILVFIVALIVGLTCYQHLFQLILEPYNEARIMLGHKVVTTPVITGVGGPLMLQLKMAAMAAVVVTCPYWLYQIWAFILPGLHAHERKWTRVFVAVASPMFLAGVAVGYYVLPKGLQVLISFTPGDIQQLVEFSGYFSFVVRMLLVFGVAFEIPLFVILLNLAGVLSGQTLGRYRNWIIIGTFVFAAVATPSTDPFSMLMLAIPMTALFLISEVIARTVDRVRRRKRAELDTVSDDEASPL